VAGFALAAVAVFALTQMAHHNLHVVVPGEVYRAGQMNADQLAGCITNYGIRSVLNLRGPNGGQAWYRGETQTLAQLNVAHYDLRWSSGEEVDPAQMAATVGLLRAAPKPLLIHCQGGADRTSLASALYRFAVVGKPADEAAGEMSVWYGHVTWLRPKVRAMDRSFWNYVSNGEAGQVAPSRGPTSRD
jgi:protein tyrosine/serine phosphatase